MKNFNKNVIAIVLVFSLMLSFSLPSYVMAATAVSLGAADAFSVLAGSSIVDSNLSNIISGDVGLSPGTSFGALTTAEVLGTIYAVDASGPDGVAGDNPGLLTSAQNALTAAFIAAGQPNSGINGGVVTADLGTFNGGTLTPGVYEDNDAPDSLSITGTLTLDGLGDPNAVFIFKSGSTLTTAASSEVVLINGAQACNVFWQVGSSATLGTDTLFKGNILASSSITDNGGSIVEGRLLASNGAVTLDNTTVTKATCVAPPASGGGGTSSVPAPLPLINVTKIPSPLSLSEGPGSVTYTYTATNLGIVAMNDVSLTDNKCSPLSFIDGDTNNNSFLDLQESWEYQCTKEVSNTETNTVTACGSSSNASGAGTVCDTANATVVVTNNIPALPDTGLIIPPLIHLIKVPNIFYLPASGGAVTYIYRVTNPGTEPLSDVSVIDDKCTGLPGRVLGHPGDLNDNDLLESNESWSFTCLTNLTQTTTNIGTAEGSANGLTAIDFSTTTVVVAAPKLPQTGFDVRDNLWNIIIPSGLFILIISLYFARRKQQTI